MIRKLIVSIMLVSVVNSDKITICHFNHGTKEWNTISIDESAWPMHKIHGNGTLNDYMGECIVEIDAQSPTMRPTRNPTPEPTQKPSESPTMRPTRNPTKYPTMRPTKNPTMIPTHKPTLSPTSKPTPKPTSVCPQSVIQIALDKSRSIDKKEMERQKYVIENLVGMLDIHENAMSIGVSSFALKYYQNIGITSDMNQAIKNVGDFLAKNQKSKFYTEYIPIFTHAQEVLPPDSTIVIVSDGRPFTKKYRGRNKSTIVSCNARQYLRETHPDIKVLCFQSTMFSQATPFFKCACDAIWLQTEYKDNEDFVAEQMKNFVCNQFEKKSNPCRCVDNKKDCQKVMKTNSGGDQMTIFDAVSSHCYWSKGMCLVKPQFEPIYN